MSPYYGFAPYVPVARRAATAAEEARSLQKEGKVLKPVRLNGSKIAASFWGKAWCRHLESYSDFSNRLPRGRTYLRGGSVLHLAIEKGRIEALVRGSFLYEQVIKIAPLAPEKWEALKQRCHGQIGSLLELLHGRLSDQVMTHVTDPEQGLFPSIAEIKIECSCPDSASLCKHLAAVLYGVGTLLDNAPELLFKLRGVDHNELIKVETTALTQKASATKGRRRVLSAAALNEVFGTELDDTAPPIAAVAEDAPPKAKRTPARKAVGKKSAREKTAKAGSPARALPVKKIRPAKKRAKAAAAKPKPAKRPRRKTAKL